MLPNGAVLLCDYFKSSLETIETAIDTLAEVPARRRILVLGDVSEPPGSQGEIYRGLGARFGKFADKAILLTHSFQRYKAGAVRAGMDKDKLIDAKQLFPRAVAELEGDLGPGDVVLIKGRAEQRLDRVALALQGKRVGCTILHCNMKQKRCVNCEKLKLGWNQAELAV